MIITIKVDATEAEVTISGATKPKAGRPLAKDADKTLAATKPWDAAGMSRATWFRRQQKGAV